MNIDKTIENNAALIDFAGRLLIAAIFVLSGLEKISDFAGTREFMQSKGVPGTLLPIVIALDLGGGLAIIVGWKTRTVAFLVANGAGQFSLDAKR